MLHHHDAIGLEQLDSHGHVVVKGADIQPLVEVSTSGRDTVQSLRRAAEFALEATTGTAASLKLYLDTAVLNESETTASVGLIDVDGRAVSAAVDVAALLLTCSDDFTVRAWDGQTGRCLRTVPVTREARMCMAEFGKYGRVVFTSYLDQTSKLWDVDSSRCLWTSRDHHGNVRAASFSADQLMLLTGAEDRTAKIWDVEAGYCLKTLVGHTGSVYAVHFGPANKFALTGSLDATAKLWDTSTGECVRTFTGHDGSVLAVSMSPDGTMASTGSEDNTFRIWDFFSGSCRIIKKIDGVVRSLCFSQDSLFLISLSGDGKVVLWDCASGSLKRVFEHIEHPRSCVQSASLSPIGSRLVSGDVDGLAKLWNVETGACLQSFSGHEGKILAVAHGFG